MSQYARNDFERRTLDFSKAVIAYCRSLKITIFNRAYISQVIRSSSSVAANYREANNPLGKKDFLHRLRIARKEAKETIYWLELLAEFRANKELQFLTNEAEQLMKILSAMIRNSQK